MESQSIIDRTCNGNCSKCGDCCGLFIPVTKQEVQEIKEYVKKNNILPTQRQHGNNFDARCCFYDTVNHKCNIYSVRPFVCRDFICSNEDWKQKRKQYDKRGFYNSTSSKLILASFDDLIFDNYAPIIMFMMQYANSLCNGQIEDKDVINICKYFNRIDALNKMTLYDENNNKIDGKDLLQKGNIK